VHVEVVTRMKKMTQHYATRRSLAAVNGFLGNIQTRMIDTCPNQNALMMADAYTHLNAFCYTYVYIYNTCEAI